MINEIQAEDKYGETDLVASLLASDGTLVISGNSFKMTGLVHDHRNLSFNVF